VGSVGEGNVSVAALHRGGKERDERLDAIDRPALLLGAGLRVLAYNRAAQRLVAESPWIALPGHRLALASNEGQVALRQAADAVMLGLGEISTRILMDIGSDLPWVAELRCVDDGALLILHAPALPGPGIVTAIAGHYALTPREAALLDALLAGETLTGHAVQRGISHEAVRFHAKSLLAKTGTHRQSDLVRRVLMIAAALDAAQ